MMTVFDEKFDVLVPSKGLVDEFVEAVRVGFAEARAMDAALKELRTHGARYLTRVEMELARKAPLAIGERAAVGWEYARRVERGEYS